MNDPATRLNDSDVNEGRQTSLAYAEPPLLKSIRTRDIRALERLLRTGADTGVPPIGLSPLAYACERGSAAAVRCLLGHGVAPDQPVAADWPGVTPMMVALANCSNACLCALLKAGANPNLLSNQSWFFRPLDTLCTPLMLAELTRNAPARELLLDHGAVPLDDRCATAKRARPEEGLRASYVDPLARTECAISRGAPPAVVQRCLRDVADLNAGRGALLAVAIREERPDLLELLLREGADPNLTPVELLAQYDKDGALTELLLKNGYDPAADGSNRPLLHACAAGNAAMAIALLRVGVDPDLAPDDAENVAAIHGFEDAVNTGPCTALMLACASGNACLVEALLASRANPQWQTPDGRTVLDCILTSGTSTQRSRQLLEIADQHHRDRRPDECS